MNRYPLWKSLVFAATMVIALMLALPNVFGESPALQLSRKDGELFEGATAVQPFADLLRNEAIAFEDAHTADGRVLLRFPDVGTQLRARDVIEASAPGRYAIATTFASRAPGWVRVIGLKPMSLGLDLRGGIYIMYEVDVDGAVRQTLQRLERDYRTKLRDERIQYTSVEATTGAVTVVLRDAARTAEALTALQEVDTDVTIGEVSAGTLRTTLTDEQVQARQDFAIQQNITALGNRVNALGVSEASVQRQGANRIAVQLPGVQDASEVIRLLGKTATLEFRLVDQSGNPVEAAQTGRAPLGTRLYRERNGNPVLLKRDVIATGDQLTDATSSLSEGEPAVNVRLDARGGQEMLRTTRENLGRPMAVVFIERERQQREVNGQKQVLDVTTEEVISVATIRGVFSNQFQITGLTVREGQELARLLRAGALAAPVYIVEQRLIGPSLGQDNIDQGVQALLWGSIALFIAMIVYYRWFGLVANAVLLCNVVLIAAMLSLFGAALTLPGIAGIVLTVGMAVDANILIFERMREELRLGNSPQAAIKAGYEKAFSAILDANITTFIAGLVLFLFGTGPIKGFAITLCIGIGTTMFTALVGSRAIISFIWGTRAKLAALPV